MYAVVVRPGEEPTIEPFPFPTDEVGDELRSRIGCEMLEMLPLPGGFDAWFDEEGRLTGKEPNRLIPIPGRGVFDVLGAIVIAASLDGDTVGMDEVDAERWRRIVAGWPSARIKLTNSGKAERRRRAYRLASDIRELCVEVVDELFDFSAHPMRRTSWSTSTTSCGGSLAAWTGSWSS